MCSAGPDEENIASDHVKKIIDGGKRRVSI